MAKLTTKEKNIVEMYVRYFGKTPSVDEISKYSEFKTKSAITKEIRLDSDVENNSLANLEYVENAIQNLFGRRATTNEKKYAVKKDNNPDYVLPIATILKKGSSVDKAVYNTKKLVAQMFAEEKSTVTYNLDNITRENYSSIYNTKTKKLLITTSTELETKLVEVPDNITGKTFNLTTGADTGKEFTGTAKNDLFKAGETFLGLDNANAKVYDPNLNSLDVLDGGAGKDYLNIQTEGAIATVDASISNIETINLKSGDTVGFNTTTYTGVETLNVTKANTSANLIAAATTDVNVSGVTGTVAVDGGKNVNVTVAATGTTTTIGATTGAAGTVTVTDSAQAGSAIKVDGGTDVTITASGNTGGTIDVGQTALLPTGNVKVSSTGSYTNGAATTMGAITIDGGSTVTVTQSAGITDAQKTAALTATTNNTVTQGAVNVDGGAATTSVTVVQDAAVTAANVAAPLNTANKIGVAAGNVTIADKNSGSPTLANTIATVSVTNAGTVNVDSAALATLNLAGTMLAVNTASTGSTGSATLALNTTDAKTGTITLDTDTKKVNVTNSGTSTITDLVAAGATALTVAGSGDLSFTASALINQAGLTSVNVTNTGSTNFGTTVLNNAATFTAAGGSETVKVGATTKAISMGAGNDEVILVSGATALTGSIDAGAGSADRITFEVAADVVAATATNVFEGKISGFEELEIAGINSTNGALVDLGNLDDISKVILSATNTQDLTLDNMANNGTLRVEASQTNTEDIFVIVKNAVLSTTDVMNIELSSATALATVDVTVDNVETINVKTEDTATTLGNIAHALDLNAAAATKIAVSGNAGVDFTGSAFDDANFTSFDASAVTAGAVTYTSGALVKASTVKGGAGNDVINMAAALAAVTLSGNAGNDTLTGGTVADTINGGEGNDTITGNGGADILTGGAGYDMFKYYTTATDSNGVNTDTITDFVSGTDKLGITHATKAITYAGEVSGYGTALTTLASGTATAVLDTTDNTLYVDLDGNGALTVADLAIKLNVNDLSQTDFATFGTTGADTITLTSGVDTIYGLGGNDAVTLTANTTTLAAVSTDGKSISTAGMDIIMDFNAGDKITFATQTAASYDALTLNVAGTSISKAIAAGTIVEFSGLYDYVTGTFTSSATLAADTASTTDVAATMYLYATTDIGITATQGLVLVGVASQAVGAITDSVLTIA